MRIGHEVFPFFSAQIDLAVTGREMAPILVKAKGGVS
jgi:hypothetical protein